MSTDRRQRRCGDIVAPETKIVKGSRLQTSAPTMSCRRPYLEELDVVRLSV